jgi:DNA-binding MarR family transcriptional regulator
LPRDPKQRPDVELFAEIGMIEQLARNRMERALPEGLSAAAFGVLDHFVRLGATDSPAHLAQVFHLTKGAMTNTLQRLEAQGLVSLADDPADGRRKVVTLTAAGRAAHLAALAALRPRMDTLRAAFDAAEFAAALPFLRRLRGWLEEHRAG